MARKRRFDDGGEIDALEEANKSAPIDVEPGPKAQPESEKPKTFSQAFAEARRAGEKSFTWNGKKYGTEMASSKSSSAPVSGRPRGESEPPSVTRQLADRAAADVMNARSASEARAAKARQAEAEMQRETRGKAVERRTPRISMAGVNPKTMLPTSGYAKGGSVSVSKRADGIAQRGKTRGTMVMCGGGMAKGKR